jgi:hypothetical protein
MVQFHNGLIFALIFLRCLSFGLDPWSAAQGVLLTGCLAGLGFRMLELLRRQERCWWSLELGLGALLLLAAIPAAAASADAAFGWGLWSAWLGDLLLAVYALQLLPERLPLLWAGLWSALAVQIVLVAMQHWWVHPLLLADTSFSGDLAADAAERLRNGGAYGSFDLANSLANHLVLVGAPLAGLLWRERRRGGLLLGGGLLLLGTLLALVLAGSRAAPLALLGAAAVIWAARGAIWRWIPVTLAPALLAIPAIADRLHDSFAVRLGYWQGAWDMILVRPLAGWGLDGFRVHNPRFLPLDAEPTRWVHNALLGSWVAGGLILAIPLLALLTLLVLRCLRQPVAAGTAKPPATPGWPALLPLVLLPYLVLIGELQNDNLALWPGGGSLASMLLRALALGPVAGAGALLALRSPAPPKSAIAIGLLAAATQWLADFCLVNASIVGAAAVVGCSLIPGSGQRPLRAWRLPALVLAPLLAIGLLFWQWRSSTLRQLEADLELLAQAAQQPELETLDACAVIAGLPPVTPAELANPRQPPLIRDAAARVLYDRASVAPASLEHQRDCLAFLLAGQAETRLAELRTLHPDHHSLQADSASLALATGDRRSARMAWERAIELAPAALRYRYQLWLLTTDAAERQLLGAEILRLNARVNVRNRLSQEELAALQEP